MAITDEDIERIANAIQGQSENGDKITLAIVHHDLQEVMPTIHKDHDRIGVLEGRVNSWRWISTTFTAIAAIVSGVIGVQK